MYQYGLLLAVLLVSGCQGDVPPSEPRAKLPPSRTVATVYQVNASGNNTPCFQQPDATSPMVTVLHNGQLVDLVSLHEGLTRRGKEYWLYVYPRAGLKSPCHINVRHLVPVS